MHAHTGCTHTQTLLRTEMHTHSLTHTDRHRYTHAQTLNKNGQAHVLPRLATVERAECAAQSRRAHAEK